VTFKLKALLVEKKQQNSFGIFVPHTSHHHKEKTKQKWFCLNLFIYFLSRSSFFGLVGLQKWKNVSKNNKSIFGFSKKETYYYFYFQWVQFLATCKTKKWAHLEKINKTNLFPPFFFFSFQGVHFFGFATWQEQKKKGLKINSFFELAEMDFFFKESIFWIHKSKKWTP